MLGCGSCDVESHDFLAGQECGQTGVNHICRFMDPPPPHLCGLSCLVHGSCRQVAVRGSSLLSLLTLGVLQIDVAAPISDGINVGTDVLVTCT